MADPRSVGVWGANYPNKVSKDMAMLCGYDNPQRCTAHGKRKGTCALMGNSSENVAAKQQCKVVRHSSIATNMRYQNCDQVQNDKCVRSIEPATKRLLEQRNTVNSDPNSEKIRRTRSPSPPQRPPRHSDHGNVDEVVGHRAVFDHRRPVFSEFVAWDERGAEVSFPLVDDRQRMVASRGDTDVRFAQRYNRPPSPIYERRYLPRPHVVIEQPPPRRVVSV